MNKTPTEDDVRYAYRILLGREPESDRSVKRHLAASPTLKDLRERFLRSEEFHKNCSRIFRQREAGWMSERVFEQVETEASPENLRAMFAHIASVWHKLGEVEPHFSVLSKPDYRPGNIENNKKKFFSSGKGDVTSLQTEIAGHGFPKKGYRRALDFGCGIARVTRHLADLADEVVGVDISSSHLRNAKDYLKEEGVSNVRLQKVETPDQLDLPQADLIYCKIVLQHSPPPVIATILRQLLEALLPGGIAYIQVPVFLTGYRFVVSEYLAGEGQVDGQEIHPLPQEALVRIVSETGCKLLTQYRDNSLSNPDFVSTRVVIAK